MTKEGSGRIETRKGHVKEMEFLRGYIPTLGVSSASSASTSSLECCLSSIHLLSLVHVFPTHLVIPSQPLNDSSAASYNPSAFPSTGLSLLYSLT